MHDREQRLYQQIAGLDKDIVNHKKEIRERDEIITDKEKRIFDLKKKNQELEKFRFVLDYKIKELKTQIAPREKEITNCTRIGGTDYNCRGIGGKRHGNRIRKGPRNRRHIL